MTRGAVAPRAVEALLRELEAGGRFSGVVGVTQGNQELLLDAFGYASRAWSIPATVETRFDSASITKLFTAVATLQLVEEDAFALDTSVIGYLGLEDTGISPAVTPYHLLTHTSGIADDADEEAGTLRGSLPPAAQLLGWRDGGLPSAVRRQATDLRTRRGLPLLQRGYVLLGLMIERATGSTYREYVTEHVFARAGMSRMAKRRVGSDQGRRRSGLGCEGLTIVDRLVGRNR